MGTMTTTTKATMKSRRLAAALSAPLAAVGILLGGSPIAGAQPAADNQCAGMSMTDGRTGPNPSALTRAGMINAASGPSASDGSMQSNCAPAGHG